MKNILTALWRYWKWLCVALLTTFVVLLLAATILNQFKAVRINDDRPAKCLDAGGTWDDDAQMCKAPA